VSSELELLALQKDLLVARGALQRLRILQEAAALGESFRGPKTLLAVAASTPVRTALFGLLLLVAGRGRVARGVSIAAVVIALAKLARNFAPHKRGEAGNLREHVPGHHRSAKG